LNNRNQLDGLLVGLGTAIRERRKELVMTQNQLAQQSNVHRTYISDIDRGRRNVSLSVLYAVATGLNLTVLELLELVEDAGAD
jgi:transcriptional regulator with XRE-family HTH domain